MLSCPSCASPPPAPPGGRSSGGDRLTRHTRTRSSSSAAKVPERGQRQPWKTGRGGAGSWGGPTRSAGVGRVPGKPGPPAQSPSHAGAHPNPSLALSELNHPCSFQLSHHTEVPSIHTPPSLLLLFPSSSRSCPPHCARTPPAQALPRAPLGPGPFGAPKVIVPPLPTAQLLLPPLPGHSLLAACSSSVGQPPFPSCE